MKPAFKPTSRKFDLKFILAGDSGSGKTHICGTYSKGPLHFYMFDKGGEKTLEKLINKRASNAPNLSVDQFASSDYLFSDFWTQFQQDEKDGFFEELAEENGLLVFDSLTAINAKAIKEICTKNGVNPSSIGKRLDMKRTMAKPHWGQLLSWMQTLISALQELPCAVATTVHLHTLMNSQQEVVARYPSVNGQFRQLIAVDFDEAYLLETRGSKHLIHFKESNKFTAKSRVFSIPKVNDKTMNDIQSAYLAGKDVF